MRLSTKKEQQLCIVSVEEPRIDAASALRFKDAMRQQTGEMDGHVVLDLSAVQFIDSSGLGAIVAALKNIGNDRQMAVAGLTPAVARVFQLTRMDTVFAIFSTLDGAVNELRA
ncbi:STAS domain-containing protein [uncultured Roseobacter sp.]|uniref:STAS domain-containing protein n=1 Tax=uncultured Roseobacter sp. TaxID=114847 RepID=UPI00261814FF|nr:STAS domain-containing protein [uncultured Roseobacter sp.]